MERAENDGYGGRLNLELSFDLAKSDFSFENNSHKHVEIITREFEFQHSLTRGIVWT